MYTDENLVEFTDIAIVGVSGRFPDANTIEQFFNNIKDGKESIRLLNDDEIERAGVSKDLLKNSSYKKFGAVLDNIKEFDNEFFGFNPYEAKITDPQHRLFLECVWEALEDSGYIPNKFDGLIGLYGSTSMSSYLLSNLLNNEDIFKDGINYPLLIANDKDYLCTRASYKLNLRGPSMTVQTACSSSLVAIHLACQSLINQECDIALAGGVSITVPQTTGYLYKEGGILSKDGHCRAFDDSASGTVKGNGCGVIALKRLEEALEDKDSIYAVIKSTAVNNDGSNKIGFTAPSVQGQAKVIDEAISLTGISPSEIQYVETHGTGTPLGDPIEIRALSQAFQDTDKKQYCAIGSLKTNIGHLDAAAGVAGVIKTALCLKNDVLPKSLNFSKENKQINFKDSPFYVNTSMQDLKNSGLNYAGVSAFGLGGTNGHAILSKAPKRSKISGKLENRILILSGRSPKVVKQMRENLYDFLSENDNVSLLDTAYTLALGREEFAYRSFIVGKTKSEIMAKLSGSSGNCEGEKVGNLNCLWNLSDFQTKEFYKEMYNNIPYFKTLLDTISSEISEVFEIVINSNQILNINEWNDDLLSSEQKKVLSDFANMYGFTQFMKKIGINPDSIYCHNRVQDYVAACISGAFVIKDALKMLRKTLLNEKLDVNDIKYSKPAISIISSNGLELNEMSQNIGFWSEIFKNNLEYTEVINENAFIINFVTLSTIYKGRKVKHTNEENYYSLLRLIGECWSYGFTINWKILFEKKEAGRISLPTYPFDRKVFWVESTKQRATLETNIKDNKLNNEDIETIRRNISDIWVKNLEEDSIAYDDDYYEIGGDSLTAVEIVSEIRDVFNIEISIDDFIEYATIDQLASFIKKQLDKTKSLLEPSSKIITKVKKGVTDKNIFLVHPAGGTVFCYRDLAQYLDEEISIYGIQFPYKSLEEKELSLEELAGLYINEIKKVQAYGPYTIGGYSFGGNVALEMALQLEQAGEKVESIVMFDSHPPHAYNQSPLSDIQYIEAFPYIVDMYFNQTNALQLKENEKYASNSLQETIKKMKSDNKLPSTIDENELIHFYSIWTYNHSMLKQYHPKGVFKGDIIMFKALQTENPVVLDLLKIKYIEKEQWNKYIKGRCTMQEVPGDHYTMFGNKENCRELAVHFQQFLQLQYTI